MKQRYTLRPGEHLKEVFVYRDPVDFRKGHRGLSMIIEHELGRDPFSGCLYIFGNRQRTRIKCLFWEDNGFVLYYKALAEEHFCWPNATDEIVSINGQQLNWLLSGYDLSVMKPHRKLAYESVG